MPLPPDNPFLDTDRIKNMFPPGHPENEERMMTTLQSFAYPILLWFFDGQRSRGTGRSYLMALICIELAMRGNRIYLNDVSTWPLFGKSEPIRKHFIQQVMDIIQTHFKEHYFEFRESSQELVYKGKRPK